MADDLEHFRKNVEDLKRGGCLEFEMNLACWLGERAHLLIARIDRLETLNAKLLAACEEFLKAYDDMPEQYTYFKDAARLARTAVAEARGVTPSGTPSPPHP
jgi:hypothetical protein